MSSNTNSNFAQRLARWAVVARHAALETLVGTPVVDDAPESVRAAFASAFRDEFGDRRTIDAPILAWVMGLPHEPSPSPAARADESLWALLASGSTGPLPALETSGAFFAQNDLALEAWTEAQLACLHALWNLAHARRDDALRDLAIDGARWLIREIQPDNATNHAWALHVFAHLAAQGDPEADLYAQTLLHNCRVTLGRPDVVSALLLLDASRQLDASRPLDAGAPRA